MRSETPYGTISFAPFAAVPHGKEWARDPSGPIHGDNAPGVLHGGVRYDEFGLWANCWMEDESRWDGEVHAVHALLLAAAPLDDGSRIMRLQITSYEACHYAFPGSIMRLLASIGDGKADRTLATGCDAQYAGKIQDSRRGRIEAYASVLDQWAGGRNAAVCIAAHADHADDARRICEMLGTHTRQKSLYARRLAILVALLAPEADGTLYRKYSQQYCYPEAAEVDRQILLAEGMSADEVPHQLDPETFAALADRVNPVLKKISGYHAVNCRHNLFHHFDIWISSVGCGTWRGAMPATGANKRQIEETVATLVCALDGWLAGLSPDDASKARPQSLAMCQEVNGMLGETTPTKRYLVAMLWKRLRCQKGRALVEANPEAFRARWMDKDGR